MSKVFSKDMIPKCEYCSTGLPCRERELVVCPKKGITQKNFSCRSFSYDPVLRTPKPIPVVKAHDKSEFEI